MKIGSQNMGFDWPIIYVFSVDIIPPFLNIFCSSSRLKMTAFPTSKRVYLGSQGLSARFLLMVLRTELNL